MMAQLNLDELFYQTEQRCKKVGKATLKRLYI